MDGYKRLASAIAASGMEDYYEGAKACIDLAIRYLSLPDSGEDSAKLVRNFQRAWSRMKEAEEFLYSDWFSLLSDAEGSEMHKLLKKKAVEYGNKRISEFTGTTGCEN